MIPFTFNGKKITAQAGDDIALALWRAGYRGFGFSRKRHRRLGHSGSFVLGVMAEVDGIPNVRLDRVLVSAGMCVKTQNVWPSAAFDLFGLFRLLPAKWVRGGFEHPRFLPSGTWRFGLWERLLRFLAGGGRLAADAKSDGEIAGRKLSCDALIVGAGKAGLGEATRLAGLGRRVLLVTRGAGPKVPLAGVEILPRHEVFGVYRQGHLVAAAPFDAKAGAVVIDCAELVLATGRRSLPPLVPGNDLPGVMEAPLALRLASAGIDLGRVIVLGSGAEADVAAALTEKKQRVLRHADVRLLQRILGRRSVRGVLLEGKLACDTLVHAGPWAADHNLAFQAAADGKLRLTKEKLPANVRLIGGAAEGDEAPHLAPRGELPCALLCTCMDVSAGEVMELIKAGVTHVEEIKRQTSCGMGPCQGHPCWELLRGLLAKEGADGSDRPSHRPPRAALTVAQAAGLADLVEPLQ